MTRTLEGLTTPHDSAQGYATHVVSGEVLDAPTDGAPENYDKVFVSQEEWAAFTEQHGGNFGRTIEVELIGHNVKGEHLKLALVMIAARMVAASPADYVSKAGNVNGSKLQKDMGLSNSASTRTLIKQGVQNVLKASAPLYGPATPELFALALAYQKTHRENQKKTASKGKSAPAEESAAGQNDSPSQNESEVKPLTAIEHLERLTELVGEMDADDDNLLDILVGLDNLVAAITDKTSD